MDEHIEIFSDLRLDLALHLFHLLPHLLQLFLQFGGPCIRRGFGGVRYLTEMGHSVLIGRASFVIPVLILILVPSFLVARNFFVILALARIGNFPP